MIWSRITEMKSLSALYLEKVFKVGLVVDAGLEQHGSVDLVGAEADVRLHVGQLGSQDVTDHLHRHVVPAHLFTSVQRPANSSTPETRSKIQHLTYFPLSSFIIRGTACHRMIFTSEIWCCMPAVLSS